MKSREQIEEKRKKLYEQAKTYDRAAASSSSPAERELNQQTAAYLRRDLITLTWVLED